MANPFRNETTITLGSKTFTLRPTFDALAQIEASTIYSICELAMRVPHGKATMREMKAIISFCSAAADENFTDDEIEAAMMDAGLPAVIKELGPVLLTGLSGAPTDEKKVVEKKVAAKK